MEEEREIWVGENRLYIDDNIIGINIVGEVDDKMALTMKEAYLKLKNMIEDQNDILVDLDKAGKQSAGARKTWKVLNEYENTGKIAMFGMNPVARVIASFVKGVSSKEDIRFFKTKEEAFEWLKE